MKSAPSWTIWAISATGRIDNAVAHDAEISTRRNLTDWNPHVCWTLYRDPARLVAFLQSTWIRPEDLPHYEDLADLVKLATRQHTHPRMVLEAYTSGKFHGNLMNLMEPCFAPALAPRYIANEAFPADWFEHTSRCNCDGAACAYCARVLRDVLKTYDREPPQ
ncbi:MAG: hypothetical protein LC725_07305 [Lentisphaerae bacterium]|nr:hypothetical protein [Lentisphaerota bacterium]